MKRNYYDRFSDFKFRREFSNEENKEIKSDFSLILKLIFEFILYVLFFIPRLLGVVFFMFSSNKKSSYYFKKIIYEPIRILGEILKWFFSAKYTAFLIIFLILMFFFQIFVLERFFDINNFLYSIYDLFNGNYYSIFTSIFLHASLSHLFGNLLFLLIFGRIVEKYFGKFVIHIFIFSGIFANLFAGFFYYLFSDQTKALGASGGIAGLVLIAILLNPFTLTTIFIFPIPIFILGWTAIIIDIFGLLNAESNTNHFAHLGGYLALLLTFFFLDFKNKNKILKGLSINLLLFLILYLGIKYFGLILLINQIKLLVLKN